MLLQVATVPATISNQTMDSDVAHGDHHQLKFGSGATEIQASMAFGKT